MSEKAQLIVTVESDGTTFKVEYLNPLAWRPGMLRRIERTLFREMRRQVWDANMIAQGKKVAKTEVIQTAGTTKPLKSVIQSESTEQAPIGSQGPNPMIQRLQSKAAVPVNPKIASALSKGKTK